MTIQDLQATLARLLELTLGDAFWLTTTPNATD